MLYPVQEKYQNLLDDFEKRINPVAGYKVIETPESIIPLEKNDPSSQKIVILDDYVCEKNQNDIINYFINGRHFNCSVIYLSQSFFQVPKIIRDTTSHFCIFGFHPKENKRIADDLGIDPSSLKKATSEPYYFLFYDKPRKKELKNFDETI